MPCIFFILLGLASLQCYAEKLDLDKAAQALAGPNTFPEQHSFIAQALESLPETIREAVIEQAPRFFRDKMPFMLRTDIIRALGSLPQESFGQIVEIALVSLSKCPDDYPQDTIIRALKKANSPLLHKISPILFGYTSYGVDPQLCSQIILSHLRLELDSFTAILQAILSSPDKSNPQEAIERAIRRLLASS